MQLASSVHLHRVRCVQHMMFHMFGGVSHDGSLWELEAHCGNNGCENACMLVGHMEIVVVFMLLLYA